MKRWWCMGCQAQVRLNKHGRCEVCESEAVDLIETDNELSASVSTADAEEQTAAVSS